MLTRVVFGVGAASALYAHLKARAMDARPLLISDEGLAALGLLARRRRA